MKKLILLSIVAIVLVAVVLFLFSRDTAEAPVLSPSPHPSPTATEGAATPIPAVSKISVTYSNSGYSSAIVTVKKGDSVIFENKGSFSMWTASAVHPTHKVYPGTDIANCGTPQSTGAFDACKGYSFGESWEFEFNETGTWKYHNHLQPSHTGTIVVE